MNRLAINFAGRGRGSRWASRALLAAALALSLDAALSFRELRATLDAGAAQLARAEPARAPARRVAPEELAAARETLDRLALPWAGLFEALESAATDQVALLALEPDPKTGTVVISADGKDYLAALSYVLNLGRAEALQRVHLVRHEAKANDPQGAVSFAVSAAWNGAKP